MSIVLVGSTSGSVTLQEPAVAGTSVLSLPALTGTVLTTASTFGGTGPAFSAYATSNQSISALTNTKVIFQAEDFDTANAFDSTTNYRFTPQVAGYYQINANINFANTSSYVYIMLAKNGGVIKTLAYAASSGVFFTTLAGSCVVQMNGSTDYLEIFAYVGVTMNLVPANVGAGNTGVNFNGVLVRSA